VKKLQVEVRSIFDGMAQCPCHPNTTTTKGSRCSKAYKCAEFGSPSCIAFGEEDYLEKCEEYLQNRELKVEVKNFESELHVLQRAIQSYRKTCNCVFDPKPEESLCQSCDGVRKFRMML
jgi:hypothetical protein